MSFHGNNILIEVISYDIKAIHYPRPNMSDPIRKVMSLVDANKDNISEGDYLEMCNNLKLIYATGDNAKDMYLLNVTNDYLEALETIETLRHEMMSMKRELLRARVSRFEHVARPIVESNGILATILGR